MRELTIHCISDDNQPSSLMPFCVSFAAARHWYSKAGASSRQDLACMIRVEVEEIGLHNIIDISNRPAQLAYFQNNVENWGPYVRNNHSFLSRSIANAEALVMWRGRLSIDLMTVVDTTRGDALMPYKALLAQLYVGKVSLSDWTSNIVPSSLRKLLTKVIGDEEAIHAYVRKYVPALDQADTSTQETAHSLVISKNLPQETAGHRSAPALTHRTELDIPPRPGRDPPQFPEEELTQNPASSGDSQHPTDSPPPGLPAPVGRCDVSEHGLSSSSQVVPAVENASSSSQVDMHRTDQLVAVEHSRGTQFHLQQVRLHLQKIRLHTCLGGAPETDLTDVLHDLANTESNATVRSKYWRTQLQCARQKTPCVCVKCDCDVCLYGMSLSDITPSAGAVPAAAPASASIHAKEESPEPPEAGTKVPGPVAAPEGVVPVAEVVPVAALQVKKEPPSEDVSDPSVLAHRLAQAESPTMTTWTKQLVAKDEIDEETKEQAAKTARDICAKEVAAKEEFDVEGGPPVNYHIRETHVEADVDYSEVEEDESEILRLIPNLIQTNVANRESEIEAGLTPDRHKTLMQVRSVEASYLERRNEIKSKALVALQTEDKWRSSRPEISNPSLTGYCEKRYSQRRVDAQKMFESPALTNMLDECKQLEEEHRRSIKNTLQRFFDSKGNLPEWIPVAPFTIQALQSGPQPSLFPKAVRYADIFDHLGFITKHRGVGRTCNAHLTEELPIPDDTPANYPWGDWFMAQGGFTNAWDVDASGMTPLMHACDQSLVFKRAGLAVLDLIRITPLHIINLFIIIETPHYPVGYNAIHLLASGVDKNNSRPTIVKALIGKKADLHARTQKAPHNTAATLAAGQGGGQMLTTLYQAGADSSATNSRGLGQRQGGRQCSSAVRQIAQAANVPNTHSTGPKRARSTTLPPPNKAVRHQAWQSQFARERGSHAQRSPARQQHEWQDGDWQQQGWHGGSQPSPHGWQQRSSSSSSNYPAATHPPNPPPPAAGKGRSSSCSINVRGWQETNQGRWREFRR